jgi:hypothetical protein
MSEQIGEVFRPNFFLARTEKQKHQNGAFVYFEN